MTKAPRLGGSNKTSNCWF